MSGTYKLKRSGAQFMWNLHAANGEIILTSERYTTKQSALTGIASCKVNSPHDERYARLTSTAKEPYFVLKAANGEPIGTSEMYSSVQARDNGIDSCKRNGPDGSIQDLT